MTFFERRRNGASTPPREGRDDLENIKDIFSESDHLHFTQKPVFIVIAALTILAYVVYLVILFVPKFSTWLAPDNTGVSTGINSLTGVLIAALASVLVVVFVNRANQKRLDYIKNLGRKDILQSLFHILRGYDGRYSEMKKIYFTLGEPIIARDGFIAARCSIKTIHSFKPNSNTLKLGFQALNRNIPDDAKREVPLLGPGGLDELYTIDSTDILEHFKDQGAEAWFHGITEVYVDNRRIAPPAKPSAGGRQEYPVDISQQRLTKDIVDLTYVYEFAVEIPGFYFFEAREPTRGFVCQIDYTRAKHWMNCYSVETFHSTTYHHDISGGDGVITISTSEWVFPRSSAMFCWYKNKAAEKASREEAASGEKAALAPPAARAATT